MNALSRYRGVVGCILLAVAVLSGCSSPKDDDASPSETEPTIPQPYAVSGDERLLLTATSTEERNGHLFLGLHAVNSSDREFGMTYDYQPVIATGGDGTKLTGAAKDLRIPAGAINDLVIEFDGTFETSQPFEVVFKRPSSGLSLSGIPFDKKGPSHFAAPVTRSANAVDTVGYHPSGISVIVYTVSATADGAEVSFKAISGDDVKRDLSSSSDMPVLIDDTGARLVGLPPVDGGQFTVPAYGRLSGTMRFVGRFSPTAKTARLVLGERMGRRDAFQYLPPRIEIGNLPVPAADAPVVVQQPALPALPKAQTFEPKGGQVNDLSISVTGVSFHEDHIEMAVTAKNASTTAQELNGATVGDASLLLEDDKTVQYLVSPPQANPKLTLSPGSTQTYNLIFMGRISTQATALTLIANSGDPSNSAGFDTNPRISVGPIAVVR